ncbi:MAG: VOC family protein, partial [Actinomycetota bacterium]|nr:VOC family protein [Actinomycetota bacterium]
MPGIARLTVFALDCRNPQELAAFYGAITGWKVDRDGG